MSETSPLIASADFVLYSSMAEFEVREVDLVKIAVDRQKGPKEDLHD